MERRFKLANYGSTLWSREKGRTIRARIASVLEESKPGDVLAVDMDAVEAFDFSFADELFGKILVKLGVEFPGRFLVVENLSDYIRENLSKCLESLNLAVIERRKDTVRLLGKVHPADEETFAELVLAGAVSAGALSKTLEVNLTAMNERLAKLTGLGLVRREKGSSATGREQYVYRVLA